MKKSQGLIAIWLMLLFLVTFSSLLVYVVAQQSIRLGANEVPMQLAVLTVDKLDAGQPASAGNAIQTGTVDIRSSLETFVLVFDDKGNLLASSGRLGDAMPVYPAGVLSYVAQHGVDRVTWQTASGLRFASVAVPYAGGVVVAAQSLTEPENRTDAIGWLVLAAWAAGAAFVTIVSGAAGLLLKKRP